MPALMDSFVDAAGVASRIDDKTGEFFAGGVYVAAAIEAITNETRDVVKAGPACWVYPVRRVAAESPDATNIRQRVGDIYSALAVVQRPVGDFVGEAVAAQLHRARAALTAALIDWRPNPLGGHISDSRYLATTMAGDRVIIWEGAEVGVETQWSLNLDITDEDALPEGEGVHPWVMEIDGVGPDGLTIRADKGA